MSDAVTFYGIIRNTFLVTGWREAAKGQPYSGMNLFIRRNIGGFDGYGQVTDYTRRISLPARCRCVIVRGLSTMLEKGKYN